MELTCEVIPYGLTQGGGCRRRGWKERYKEHPSLNISVRGPELPLLDTYSKEMKQNGNILTHTHRCLVQNNQAWKPPTLGDVSPQHTEQLKGTSGWSVQQWPRPAGTRKCAIALMQNSKAAKPITATEVVAVAVCTRSTKEISGIKEHSWLGSRWQECMYSSLIKL